jgi:signal transduction histidine kinase
LQVPIPQRGGILSLFVNYLASNIPLLVLVTPVGLFFGWITTRSLVRRVQRLVLATTQFAGGDYTQRVVSSQQDEIGQLERQFNLMAEQLVENIARRQQLAEQNARLEERTRISRELHDAISQDLFSLRMLADGLQEATRSDSSSANLRPQIALLEQTSANITREMRALLLELRPTQLEELGLTGALKELARAYSTRLGITVTVDLKPITLNVKAEHALLRIAQEALANAARHSSASIISLSLGESGGLVRLTIEDNGEGFSREQESVRHGLGLQVMQERVEELHGTFDPQTAPGQGTRIVVSLPLEDARD